MKIPSLGEFDQGVEALIKAHGPRKDCTPSSPLTGIFHSPAVLEPLRPIAQPQLSSDDSANGRPMSRPGTITSHGQYPFVVDYPPPSLQRNYGHSGTNYGNGASRPSLQAPQNMDCYPSPPPEGEGRHINQKYTTEEGDYIIYAWHDKKMKWRHIRDEFAVMFGTTPERSIQGLQAWYYRMNQRIPVWDQSGRLCFNNEDDLEPRHVSIKARDRDIQGKPTQPLGIAQRYPERAIHYSWVDLETKSMAQDWATKRAMQYKERRKQRRRRGQNTTLDHELR